MQIKVKFQVNCVPLEHLFRSYPYFFLSFKPNTTNLVPRNDSILKHLYIVLSFYEFYKRKSKLFDFFIKSYYFFFYKIPFHFVSIYSSLVPVGFSYRISFVQKTIEKSTLLIFFVFMFVWTFISHS